MTATAADVSSYIEGQPETWRPSLKKLRALCRRELRGYSEGIAYGMPSYARKGQMEIGFGKQARYLSFYVLRQPVLDAHRAELVGLSVGKGCVRFRTPEQIDWDLLRKLVTETAASGADIC
jgi:uncharacterized protein YdhG (YjbR/CyaY superfamily)